MDLRESVTHVSPLLHIASQDKRFRRRIAQNSRDWGLQTGRNLEQNVLREQLSGRLKGEPTQTRSSAFIDPVRNLSVSGGSQLRLGSLLSAFISVSFAFSLSCAPSFSLHLYLPYCL